MIDKSLQIYRKNKVDLATLEALKQNNPAIQLYKKIGYDTVQTLHFHTLSFAKPPVLDIPNDCKVTITDIHAIKKLSFWNTSTPWQAQISDQSNDYAAILWDEQKNPLSYAIFHKTYDQDGNYIQCTLKHCEINPFTKENKQTIYIYLLSHVFPFLKREQIQISSPFVCSTHNLLMDVELSNVLQDWGFERRKGQVWMQLAMQ